MNAKSSAFGELDDYYNALVAKGAPPDQARSIVLKMVSARKQESSEPSVSQAPTKQKSNKFNVVKPLTALPVPALKEDAKRRAGTYDDPKATYQLPLWLGLDVRVIPNHLARSSLFAPLGKKKGPRTRHSKAVIASRSDVSIMYSGPQLDMADCDVFMQALHLARGVPLGQPVYFLRSNFLAALEKSDAGAWYVWLEGAIERLLEATLYIKTKRYIVGDPEANEEPVEKRQIAGRKHGLHLIAGFEYDEKLESYYLLFDQRILALFQNNEFSLVGWKERFMFKKRVDLSKWLQNYICSHEPGIHRIGINLLRGWCHYSSPLNKFRVALEEALQELQRVGIIEEAVIRPSKKTGDQTASWVRLDPGR